MITRYTRADIQRIALVASARKSDATRHKCFIAYHVADGDEVAGFLDAFGEEFIPRSLGVTEDDDFIDSTNEEYIKQAIRDRYLRDSTVTIVLLGECTWARKFVDWEISSTLRNDEKNKRSGLLVYPLPSRNNTAILPGRVKDNWVKENVSVSYASYMSYPSSKSTVRSQIETAFSARISKAHLVNNTRSLKQRNSSC